MWTWKDPATEPPPLRTRIRIRLSDEFRKALRMEPTCVDGYIHEPDTLPMYGFSTALGPHVTGWMPLPKRDPIAESQEEDRLTAILERLAAKVQERELRKSGDWYRTQPTEEV